MVGQTISHYKITAKLGEGGMGVVYKAEDTSLGRPVALKFLAAHLIKDGEARKRFEREARAAAALQHPNICTIHEIGETGEQTFLAMAFIDGESLESIIAKGPLPLPKALDIAQQIVKGLHAAHEKRIVHRDIKPANAMVDAHGHVTVMDFGLALLTEGSKLTQLDSRLGTVAYMSPEQAQGMEVDHRTDIWAIGCVLYQMISGQRPFRGQYDQALLYEIVNEEPAPLTGLRSGVPLELEWIVTKALAKQAADRYQSLHEMTIDLRALSERSGSGRSRTAVGPASIVSPSKASPQVGASLGHDGLASEPAKASIAALKFQRTAALAGFALALLALAAVWISRPASEPPQLLRFSVTSENSISAATISPNGRFIAFTTRGEHGGLWIQDLQQAEPSKIEAVVRPDEIAWSPDSLTLAIEIPDALVTFSISSRTVKTVCTLDGFAGARLGTGLIEGMCWRPDGATIAFAAERKVYEAPALGGSPREIFSLSEDNVGRLAFPHYLPVRGGSYPLLATRLGVETEDVAVELINVEDGQMSTLLTGAAAVYSPSGHILFQDTLRSYEASLWGVRFSVSSSQTIGEPFLVSENAHAASPSQRGDLVYLESPSESRSQLVIRNRGGELIRRVGEPADLLWARISPDGERIAVRRREKGNSDIWAYEIETGAALRLTDHPLNDSSPIWSPDGSRIVYSSVRGGQRDLYIVRRDGSQPAKPLFESPGTNFPMQWSRDGRYLLYTRPGEFRLLTLDANGKVEDSSHLQVSRSQGPGTLSPQGDYLAYTSQESGRDEVYVRPFPSGEGKWRISSGGGHSPRWIRNGGEIVYLDGRSVVAASVQREPLFKIIEPQGLGLPGVRDGRAYDVADDGETFVLIERNDEPAIGKIRVVQNWFEEFRGQGTN